MRRIVFAGVIIALYLYKELKNKSFLVVIYLLPIIIFNGFLYYRENPNMPLQAMQKEIDELPPGQVLVQSHYYRPFTHYNGTILWIGNDDLSKIDGYLSNGHRVFMTKESVTAPYLLVVGNNYHITSLNRVGESESKVLFKKYVVNLYADSLEFKLPVKTQSSSEAGEPIIFYASDTNSGNGFWGRLSRRRIDYGDVGVWLWAIIANHHDSTGWTYKDVSGAWVYPGIKVK